MINIRKPGEGGRLLRVDTSIVIKTYAQCYKNICTSTSQDASRQPRLVRACASTYSTHTHSTHCAWDGSMDSEDFLKNLCITTFIGLNTTFIGLITTFIGLNTITTFIGLITTFIRLITTFIGLI